MSECTEESFMKDVANHEMRIIRDDGLYRHIRFKRVGTWCTHFDLITWPGYLCYTGDMGTYVFQRLDDMFEFFRMNRNHMRPKDGKTLAINLGYWAEKVEAKDRHGDLKEFSEEMFNRAVVGDLVAWLRSRRDQTTKEDRRELWCAVMNEVIGADGDSGGYRKQAAAHDFSHHVNDRVGDFYFQDFWDNNVEDYTHRFVWCCYALAWGIQKYDDAKAPAVDALAHNAEAS